MAGAGEGSLPPQNGFWRRAVVGGLALGVAAGCATSLAPGLAAAVRRRQGAADALVLAPHPDDEVLGAAGVIDEAVRDNRRLLVALLTNGDAHTGAAARLAGQPQATRLSPAAYLALAAARQAESLAALALLGLPEDRVLFLGFPDGHLRDVLTSRGATPVRSKLTGMVATYAAARPDQRSRRSGRPAPYTGAELVAEVAWLLDEHRPRDVYVTHARDTDPDHAAAFRVLREALRRTGLTVRVHAMLIRSGSADSWPNPPWPARRATPERPFERTVVDGVVYPRNVPWPPDERRPLARPDRKEAAIRRFVTQLAVDAEEHLLSFVKNEEVFWRAS